MLSGQQDFTISSQEILDAPVRHYLPWFSRLSHVLARDGALLLGTFVRKGFDERALDFQPMKITVKEANRQGLYFTHWLAP